MGILAGRIIAYFSIQSQRSLLNCRDCKYVLRPHKKDLTDGIRLKIWNTKMRLAYLSGWAHYNHKDPDKRESRISAIATLSIDKRRGHEAKNSNRFRKLDRRKQILPWSLPKEPNLLTLQHSGQGNTFEIMTQQNCKITNMCCFKSLNLWSFVTATIENLCRFFFFPLSHLVTYSP